MELKSGDAELGLSFPPSAAFVFTVRINDVNQAFPDYFPELATFFTITLQLLSETPEEKMRCLSFVKSTFLFIKTHFIVKEEKR